MATPNGDVLAPLLSVTGEIDAVTIGSQEASSVQGKIPGIITNPNNESLDIECDVRLVAK